MIEFQQKPNLYKAMNSEVKNWKADAKAIKKMGCLSNTLLFVIGRDKRHVIQQGIEEGLPETEITLLEDTWEQLIREQATLSENSNLIYAAKSTHSVHLDRSDLIIAIVKELFIASK
ncbi:alpha/beta hydrolase [Planococcus antarcticus DSM 14505]|uniref:Alpha/beta hydrolase n=1 Tax=Planococcus antarcticus DSM 14505 TaxID=1185653 RepID=A0AA87LSG7_9BACL|nr:hypothetical protein [Planococcus antarcticus]EIM07031.1 alpha/beta hydrolase [Planococcus antarcticus DSM 14505]